MSIPDDAADDPKARLQAAMDRLAANLAAAKASSPDESHDLLCAAVADVAAHYGVTIAPHAIAAGLPLRDGRLPLDHIELAAQRAGLSAAVDEVAIEALEPFELPVIALMNDGGCDIVWQLHNDQDGRAMAAVLSPAGRAQARVKVPLAEVDQAATCTIIRLRPRSGADERGEAALRQTKSGWFLPAFLESRRIYGEAIAATVALNLLALALPLFTMNVYDRVLPNAVEATLWALAIGASLATAFDFLIKTLRADFVDIASRRADVRLSNLIYGRLLGARTPNKPVSAGVRANALREFETLREFFNSATLTTFGDLPFLVIFLVMIWVIAGPLAVIPVLAVPLVLFAGWLTQRTLAKASEQSFRETAQKNAIVVETVVGMESVKAAGAESWAATRWEQAVSDHIRSSHQIRRTSTLGVNAIFAIQTLTQIMMVIAGFYMVKAGNLTTGGLIAGTMLAGRAMQPLGQIAMLISRLYQTRLAFRAVSEIVELEQERPDGVKLISTHVLSGALACEHLSFRYEQDAPPCLDDVSFAVASGERVGLIGAIGSGKTTLLKLIHAVHLPASGRVLLDGIPAHQMDPALLRANIGLALQDADLFHGTIRSNIAMAAPGAGDQEVFAAARAAGALEWILRMPKGFDTPVRERGAGLSGGQRQSVALARALFRNPRIVLLDEPTSDMDIAAEQHVVRSLDSFLKGRTLIAISHRPAVLALVERLIVLENGRKILDGPKAEVLNQLKAVNAERNKPRNAMVQPRNPAASRDGAA
ncbi:MAG: type I secretion system permease/ATPase [Hyphomicrobium sp.]|nr:type I secretion system permease/ATPase [Hyphomicrobium sp.]